MILLSDHSPPTTMPLQAVGMKWAKGAKGAPTTRISSAMAVLRKCCHRLVRITEAELDRLPSSVSRLQRALFVPRGGKMYVPTTNVIYLTAD
jgi:hypothetical protein